MLNPTDNFLVNDGSITETVTWSDIKGGINPLVVSVVIVPNEPVVNEEVTATPVMTGGEEPYTINSYQWHTADDADGTNQVDISGATQSTYTPVSADAGKFLGCTVTATDNNSVVVDGTGYASLATDLGLVLNQPTVIAPADGAGVGGDVTYTPKTSAITTIGKVFGNYSTTLYTGDGGTQQVDTGVDNTTKSLIWVKALGDTTNHCLASPQLFNGHLRSNGTETVEAITIGEVSDYSSSGFEITNKTNWMNKAGNNYVAWNFAAAEGFFDVVTYTGNGGTQEVPHNLGSVPGLMIVKARANYADDWFVYHRLLKATKRLKLNQNVASQAVEGVWNNTEPTDSVFTVGRDNGVNGNTYQYVAYLFAHNPDKGIYIAQTTNSTVPLGFKPGWVMVKTNDRTSSWYIFDSKRGDTKGIKADLSNVEGTDGWFSFQEDGFTCSGFGGDEYIFVAIAEDLSSSSTTLTLTDANTYNNADGSDMGQPISETFTAGQTVKGENATGTYGVDTAAFSTTVYMGNSGTQQVPTGVDNTGKSLIWVKARTDAYNHALGGEHIGPELHLISNETFKPQGNSGGFQSFDADGYTVGAYGYFNTSGKNYVAWNFRAAPGFFDVVTYEGTGVNADDVQSVPHSLGSVPGMMIIKRTNDTEDWGVYHKSLPTPENNVVKLNSTNVYTTNTTTTWGQTNPTASEFYVGRDVMTGGAGNSYVAYLFADTPGKIKCSKYDGNSSTQQIDCGFAAGWVMIKAFNGGENWQIFDNQRLGPVYPNLASAESTGDTFVSFNANGFNINSANNSVNGGGLTYIYVAIAEDVVAGQMPPTGTLTADAVDNGPTITLTDVTGTWEAGMEVVNNTEATKTGPGADVLEFVGSIPSATPADGVTTWGDATWQVSVDSAFTTPMEATKLITDATTTQVLLETERGPITLEADTDYWVRLKYASSNPDAESIYSEVNHFKTATTFFAYNEFNQQYYDKTNAEGTTGNDLAARFGIDPTEANLKQFGIAELTQQPTGEVDVYVPENGKYTPIRSYKGELDRANARLAAIRQAFEDRLNTLEVAAASATEPFDLNGYYPLYYTEAAADAASSSGTSHSHTIDGTEYFMPDSGTIYHGNYGDSSY